MCVGFVQEVHKPVLEPVELLGSCVGLQVDPCKVMSAVRRLLAATGKQMHTVAQVTILAYGPPSAPSAVLLL